MYQYKAAKARTKGVDATWLDVDLSTIDINQLFTTYAKVILTLTHVSISHDLYLDMDAARAQIPPSTKVRTINQWLTSLGSATLPTTDIAPLFQQHIVRCADAWDAGYTIEPVDRKRAYNAQIPLGDKNDLLLSRTGVDFVNLWRYCMVSVNGLFHRVGGSPEGLYVVEGGRTGAISKDNQVSIMSFRDVASLEYIPILPGMVYKTHPSQAYGDYANVKLPAPVEGKTIMMVLGGYLHILDKSYVQTGAQSIRINLANLPLPERIFESLDRINLESLNLIPGPNGPHHFSVDQIYSDEVIEAYLTLPQSFFIVVNTPHLFARQHFVEKTKLPGRFIAPMPFTPMPLFSALGRNYIYKPRAEWGEMVLACDNAKDTKYQFDTMQWQTQLSLDDKPLSSHPWDFARGYMLEIGCYTV